MGGIRAFADNFTEAAETLDSPGVVKMLSIARMKSRLAATGITLGVGLAFGYAVTKAWVEGSI
jgi:hypothetical protein